MSEPSSGKGGSMSTWEVWRPVSVEHRVTWLCERRDVEADTAQEAAEIVADELATEPVDLLKDGLAVIRTGCWSFFDAKAETVPARQVVRVRERTAAA